MKSITSHFGFSRDIFLLYMGGHAMNMTCVMFAEFFAQW